MIEAAPSVTHQQGLDPEDPPWRNITSYKTIQQNIQALFGKLYGGTFVEIGAQDGMWLSNTWWLESFRNWRGLLVEADPDNYLGLRLSPRLSPTLPACAVEGYSVKKVS
ncbi:hypothetical protein SK128_028052 [Halocaridina rubra]|uniref:Uncharacterized protein n=1 Tax=Halocaridina rubra TaxID=373956 RepID=A0AAN8ZS68_HALRR